MGQAKIRESRSTSDQKAGLLTVDCNRSSRLRDPNKSHGVKTGLSGQGERRRQRLELHSAGQEPLEQVTAA